MPAEIALVEDEQNIRDTVSYALRQEGHRVLAYANGEQAWKALECKLPDLLILDILLPRVDGLELCARVKVLLRRGARRESEERLRVGPLELDPPRHTARWKGEPVRLTVTEFRMLSCLARQPGIVKTREQLLAEGFPHDQYMSDRTVDTHIKRLRRKLSVADPAFAGIETVYGLGYRYAAES